MSSQFLGNSRTRAPSADIMSGYEKLKTVGKGSFGTANLYKRLADNILVVMKHIHITELSINERQMALNEVQVISSLDHENIIKYLGSFETEGSLVIIMEYANGGNLAQLINLKRNYDTPIAENTILNIFSQICNGIGYMHMHKILHRDLKLANIFLTRDGIVKIGDFGISKMLNTKSEAQTVVGTPYYLSPEMCEGKDYNEKSDIWSMGIILYELICLKKPFEATSLPALVQKITAVEFTPIPSTYSDGLHRLVQMVLQRDCEKRPSAQYTYQTIIPAIYETLLDGDSISKLSISTIFNRSIPRERSVLYELYGFTSDPHLYPVKLPHKPIIDFSNSGTHYIVLTNDKRVYSWGEDVYGQLGHGKPSDYKKFPIYVDYFRGKNIIRCLAGESFSVFLTDGGTVYTCGDGRYGCLGHGDWDNVSKPTIINALININVITISCGATHVIALAANGQVYAWGSGKDGQLGLGNMHHSCKPKRVNLPISDINIKEVIAGYDNSILLTSVGGLLVSGSNMHNKLGLGTLEYTKEFVFLAGIDDRIKAVSLAYKHTVLLTEDGSVLCMGSNQNDQCGIGQYVNGILRVQNLPPIQMITTGTCYTIAASEDNVVYFWGTHYLKTNRHQLNETYNISIPPENNSSGSGAQLVRSESISSTFADIERRFRRLKYEVTDDAMQKTFVPVVQVVPTAILALYASPEHIQSGKLVWLGGISANDNSVSILVHTTAPPPVKRVEEDVNGQSLLLNWNRSNRIYKNQTLPNTPQPI